LDVIYIGNDLSDVDAMKLVRSCGGLAICFNGDESAVRSADIAVLSDDYSPVSVLADLFLRAGKAEAESAAGNFEKDVLWLSSADPTLLDRLFELHPNAWPKVYIVSEWTVETIVSQINNFRETI
jgi:hypothetical protein